MPKLRDTSDITQRIYARRRGAADARYYGDFRDYADVGGGQEPLVPEGSRYATTDPTQATELAAARLEELEAQRVERPTGPAAKRLLQVIIPDHLERKAKNQEGGEQWLGNVQVHLETFEDFFGSNRDIADISLREMEDYRAHLFTLPNGRAGTLSTGSIAHYLNSASNLYERAIGDQVLKPGQNLVALLPSLKVERTVTPFLEVPEMARILQFAFEEYEPVREELAIPFFPVILALLALTGLREKEALGLLVSDINLARGVIEVRPNRFRGLKTRTSKRTVPIFSQFRNILEAYFDGPHAPKGELVFPSPFGGPDESMIRELRKAYDKMPMPARLRRRRTPAELEAAEQDRFSKLQRALGKRRGPKPTESLEELQESISPSEIIIMPLRSKMLRHTYTAARLQTTDHGRPVSVYTVAQELGHKSTNMVEEVYGHLGTFRHRGEEVEFRW